MSGFDPGQDRDPQIAEEILHAFMPRPVIVIIAFHLRELSHQDAGGLVEITGIPQGEHIPLKAAGRAVYFFQEQDLPGRIQGVRRTDRVA